jgi:hypothetical protein
MAVCYRYLGEDRLCKEALDKAARAGYSAWDPDRPVRSRIQAMTVTPYLYVKGMRALATPGKRVGDEIKPVDVARLRMILEHR